MTIKQFNGTYLVNEDRVLFRFNTQSQEEYRFWLTRRVALFILAATSHLQAKKLEQKHSPEAVKALAEFGKEAALEVGRAENEAPNPYIAGLIFPLGFDPILVIDVSCSLTKNGEKLAQLSDLEGGEIDDALSIDFVLPGGANLNLKLEPATLQGMCLLLDQLRQQAGWGEAVLQLKNPDEVQQTFEVKTSPSNSIH